MPTLEGENSDFLEDLEFQEMDCSDLLDQYQAQYTYDKQDVY